MFGNINSRYLIIPDGKKVVNNLNESASNAGTNFQIPEFKDIDAFSNNVDHPILKVNLK